MSEHLASRSEVNNLRLLDGEPEVENFTVDRRRIISFLYFCGSNVEDWPYEEAEFLELAREQADLLSIDPVILFSHKIVREEEAEHEI